MALSPVVAILVGFCHCHALHLLHLRPDPGVRASDPQEGVIVESTNQPPLWLQLPHILCYATGVHVSGSQEGLIGESNNKPPLWLSLSKY